MLWLALKLRRDPTHENPTLVIVTDRKDLDEQITEHVPRLRLPQPRAAESVRDLRELLVGPDGQDDPDDGAEVPGAARRRATARSGKRARGVPAALDGREHLRARRRGAPHPVRRPRREPAQGAAQRLLLRLHRHADRQEGPEHARRPSAATSTRTPSSRRSPTAPRCRSSTRAACPSCASSATRSTRSSIASSPTAPRRSARRSRRSTRPRRPSPGRPKRIEAICLDLIDHYTKFIQPNGFKAQIVAVQPRGGRASTRRRSTA